MARMVGPAAAGLLTALVGAGPVFLINAATFLAVLTSLRFLRIGELRPAPRALRQRGNLAGGIRYVARRPDLLVIFVMVFLLGAFGLDHPELRKCNIRRSGVTVLVVPNRLGVPHQQERRHGASHPLDTSDERKAP